LVIQNPLGDFTISEHCGARGEWADVNSQMFVWFATNIGSTSLAVRIFLKDGIPSEARAPPSTIDANESSTSLLE
jgi:hypothetical protein